MKTLKRWEKNLDKQSVGEILIGGERREIKQREKIRKTTQVTDIINNSLILSPEKVSALKIVKFEFSIMKMKRSKVTSSTAAL